MINWQKGTGFTLTYNIILLTVFKNWFPGSDEAYKLCPNYKFETNVQESHTHKHFLISLNTLLVYRKS